MKTFCFVLCLCHLYLNSAYSSQTLSRHISKIERIDLDRILKKKYLRVLTTKNPYDYYISQGETKGLQYEMVKEFVSTLNQKYLKQSKLKMAFELIPVDFDQLIPMLNAGKGDFIAVGMTKTAKRLDEIHFTVPYQYVDDVIVTRKELAIQDWRKSKFSVQSQSSYAEVLAQNKIQIEDVDANLNPANILEMISLKKYNYTLVNSFWAETIGKKFDNLIILNDRPFRKKVEISWGVRKESSLLLKELNLFLPKVRKGTKMGNVFGAKYFVNVGRIQSKDFNLSMQRISQFDSLLKKYARQFGFDWRLLSAVCLQESRFNQNLKNKWGAVGLFQIKEKTAKEKYVNISPILGEKNAENNIHAGVKYLNWIKHTFFDKYQQMLDEDRFRFTLAAYNAGIGRVQKAMERAQEMGLNPNIWFRNVELAMLDLGHNEPVIYVSEINKHYVSYMLMGIL